MKFKSIINYVQPEGELNTKPSETRQSDYEPIETMVNRILRGEIMPTMPEDFEYDEKVSNEEIFAQPHPLDAENFDFGDAGSLYQDDIVDGINKLMKSTEELSNRSESGAEPTRSSSDANVPVENSDEKESE